MRFRADFLKGLRLQKKGFDCVFTMFYCFPHKIYFVTKHAKCDLTVKTNRKCDLDAFWLELRLGKIRFHLAIYVVLCVFQKITVSTSKITFPASEITFPTSEGTVSNVRNVIFQFSRP